MVRGGAHRGRGTKSRLQGEGRGTKSRLQGEGRGTKSRLQGEGRGTKSRLQGEGRGTQNQACTVSVRPSTLTGQERRGQELVATTHWSLAIV